NDIEIDLRYSPANIMTFKQNDNKQYIPQSFKAFSVPTNKNHEFIAEIVGKFDKCDKDGVITNIREEKGEDVVTEYTINPKKEIERLISELTKAYKTKDDVELKGAIGIAPALKEVQNICDNIIESSKGNPVKMI